MGRFGTFACALVVAVTILSVTAPAAQAKLPVDGHSGGLSSELQVDIKVPWGRTGVATPTPVTGTVLDGTTPVTGQRLQLVQTEPIRRDLGDVITDEQGSWSTSWTPEAVGEHVLEVRLTGDPDLVDEVRVTVAEFYDRLDVSAPAAVDGGRDIDVTLRLTRNGVPVAGEPVALRRQYQDEWGSRTEWLGELRTDESGEATFRAGPRAADYFWYEAYGRLPYGANPAPVRVDVVRADPTLTVIPARTAAPPGEAVPIAVELASATGEPLAGEEVHLHLRPSSGDAYVNKTLTTDANGRATYVDTSTAEGYYQVVARFGGSLLDDDTEVQGESLVRKRLITTTSVDRVPEDGVAIGETVTLTGQVTPVDGPVQVRVIVGDGIDHRVTTDATGRWEKQVQVTQPGAQYWAVIFEGTTRLAPSRHDFLVTAGRLATSIEVSEVTVTPEQGLDVRGRVTGLTATGPVSFQLNDEPVEYRWTDGDFWFYRSSDQLEDGVSRLVIRFEGDSNHAPSQHQLQFRVGREESRLTFGPSVPVSPGQDFEVEGHVSPPVTGPVTLGVAAPDGTTENISVEATEGRFRLPLTVADDQVDQPTWTVTYLGSADVLPTTQTYSAFLRTPRPMELVIDRPEVGYGDLVGISLRPPVEPGTLVTATIRGPRGDILHQWEGPLTESGEVLREKVTEGWDVTVVAHTDDYHLSTTRTIRVRPAPRLTSLLQGGRSTSSSAYRTYPRGARPAVRSVVRPGEVPGCVARVLERRTSTGWRSVQERCLRGVDGRSESVVRVPDGPVLRYRVRTEYHGSDWYSPSESAWSYFRFRRR